MPTMSGASAAAALLRPSRGGPQASKRLGSYQLGDEIGKGGFGTVYRGLNTETGDFVAVKQLPLRGMDKADLAAMQTEIELLKSLNHPNIVKYSAPRSTCTLCWST